MHIAKQNTKLLNKVETASPTGKKMATILADDIFKFIFLNENDKIPIEISLNLALRSSNKLAFVKAIAWRRTGDKPPPEPMIVWFTDAYMRH